MFRRYGTENSYRGIPLQEIDRMIDDAGLPTNTLRNADGTPFSAYVDGNTVSVTPEQLAQMFHETYERLAPGFGYKTREASAKPWADVPEQNKALMIAVAGEILRTLAV